MCPRYNDVVERTIQANPTQANLGGDPTVENRIRAFLTVRFYRGGQWEDKLEVWWIFFLIPAFTNDEPEAHRRSSRLGKDLLHDSNWKCIRSPRICSG